MKAKVTESSGHVYTDLGFDTGEADANLKEYGDEIFLHVLKITEQLI